MNGSTGKHASAVFGIDLPSASMKSVHLASALESKVNSDATVETRWTATPETGPAAALEVAVNVVTIRRRREGV
ncbi:hypothetical protein ABH922_004901 [Rhodococcus sp. 27YEA15]|uniref:hypothetical protein n=1 Tax=Rhodococcus sp. 27YEA15 TaxID=3156259 RepID=UPI003C7C6D2F